MINWALVAGFDSDLRRHVGAMVYPTKDTPLYPHDVVGPHFFSFYYWVRRSQMAKRWWIERKQWLLKELQAVDQRGLRGWSIGSAGPGCWVRFRLRSILWRQGGHASWEASWSSFLPLILIHEFLICSYQNQYKNGDWWRRLRQTPKMASQKMLN